MVLVTFSSLSMALLLMLFTGSSASTESLLDTPHEGHAGAPAPDHVAGSLQDTPHEGHASEAAPDPIAGASASAGSLLDTPHEGHASKAAPGRVSANDPGAGACPCVTESSPWFQARAFLRGEWRSGSVHLLH